MSIMRLVNSIGGFNHKVQHNWATVLLLLLTPSPPPPSLYSYHHQRSPPPPRRRRLRHQDQSGSSQGADSGDHALMMLKVKQAIGKETQNQVR